MITALEVVLTQTLDRKPFAIVRNLPGLDAEMTPKQMRSLAFALALAAGDCEARPMGKRSFLTVPRSYSLEKIACAKGGAQ
jgi:hypothetical protein